MKRLPIFFLLLWVIVPMFAFAQPAGDDDVDDFNEAEAEAIISRFLGDDEADTQKSIATLQAESNQAVVIRDRAQIELQTVESSLETMKQNNDVLTDEVEGLQAKVVVVAGETKKLAEDEDTTPDDDEMVTAEAQAAHDKTAKEIEQNEKKIALSQDDILKKESAISQNQEQMEVIEREIEELKDLMEDCEALIKSNAALIELRKKD